MGPALILAADEVQCPQTQWSPYKAKLLPPTHPRKVTLVTLGHMCGPTHPQVTKVTLFHVKRSLIMCVLCDLKLWLLPRGSTLNYTAANSTKLSSMHANAPHKLAWTGSVGAPIVFQRSFGVVPILQLAYYASYLTEYGTAVIWVGHDRHINVTIESRWQLKQTVVQVVSVSATKAVADRIKDGPRTLVLPSLRPGVHPVGLMVVPHSGAGAAQPTFKLDALHGCELAEVSGLG